MTAMNFLFLIAALLLFVSVIASRLSSRLGMPLLLVFLIVGMLAGEEGIGGIHFDNAMVAMVIGQAALAIILLDGGLRTPFKAFKIALKPAAALATWGVLASVGLLGLFATYYLGIDWKMGLLIAAIVGSTDAAAVFSLLRNSGVRLNARLQASLELESGLNDPMAILLVGVFISMIVRPQETDWLQSLLYLVRQMGLGILFGLGAGKLLSWMLGRAKLPEGMYALLIASGGLIVFALTNLLEGSGFLAIYLAGVMIGNAHNSSKEHVLSVMDGLAWLAQAVMFVVLGLLVVPSQLWERSLEALAIAAFLILVARPLAVLTAIKWFRYSKRELAYISWVGLRGAVPVTLAIMPMIENVPDAGFIFNIIFAVVILSLLIQGTTIPFFARKLKVVLPPKPEPQAVREVWLADKLAVNLLSFQVAAGSDAESSHPDAMVRSGPLSSGRLFALIREGSPLEVNMTTRMKADDIAWYVLPEEQGGTLALHFSDSRHSQDEQQFYGEFVVKPDIKVGDLAQAYGLQVEANEAELSLVQMFRRRFGDVPVAGDSLDIAGFRITVKELDEHSYIKWLGLKIPKSNNNP